MREGLILVVQRGPKPASQQSLPRATINTYQPWGQREGCTKCSTTSTRSAWPPRQFQPPPPTRAADQGLHWPGWHLEARGRRARHRPQSPAPAAEQAGTEAMMGRTGWRPNPPSSLPRDYATRSCWQGEPTLLRRGSGGRCRASGGSHWLMVVVSSSRVCGDCRTEATLRARPAVHKGGHPCCRELGGEVSLTCRSW